IADDLRARLGVTATALTSQAPLGPGALIVGLVPEGRPVDDGKSAVEARLRMVSPRYLATMRIPLVAGRDIDERDRHDAPPAIVVSAGFARRAWPGQSAVGKRLWCCGEKSRDGQPAWRTVVGVAVDVHSGGPAQDVLSEFYLPMLQAPREAWSW